MTMTKQTNIIKFPNEPIFPSESLKMRAQVELELRERRMSAQDEFYEADNRRTFYMFLIGIALILLAATIPYIANVMIIIVAICASFIAYKLHKNKTT